MRRIFNKFKERIGYAVSLFLWASTLGASFGAEELQADSDSIQGIVLASSEQVLKREKRTNGTVELLQIWIPGDIGKFRDRFSSSFVGKPLDEKGIEEIQSFILSWFSQEGFPLVSVYPPEQRIEGGIIAFIVEQSRLGRLEVEGGKYTNPSQISRYFSLERGDSINQNQLLKELEFSNRNPFRDSSIIYSPGDLPSTTDITIATQDRFPARFYLGGDNTGIAITGQNRWFAGFNWGKAFGFDHILSYQYTASGDFHQFQAHTIQYTALLPCQHLLNFYGGYAAVRPDLSSLSRNDGKSGQGSFRYILPYRARNGLNDEWKWGFDFKRTNNTVQFSEDEAIIAQNVNLFQFESGYEVNLDFDSLRFHFLFDLYLSPGGWLPDQTDSAYNTLRPGASNQWIYGKGGIEYVQRIRGDFSIALFLRGQASNGSLLPSEQLGIGGYDTVRGYQEREINKDSGFISNIEIRSPSFPFLSLYHRKKWDALSFLVFADYGWGTNHTKIPLQPKRQSLLSVGPAFRYHASTHFVARADWGFRLKDEPDVGGAGSLVHFSLIASY